MSVAGTPPSTRRRPVGCGAAPRPLLAFAALCGIDSTTDSRDRPRMERVRARERRRLPHPFDVCPRSGCALGHVLMA